MTKKYWNFSDESDIITYRLIIHSWNFLCLFSAYFCKMYQIYSQFCPFNFSELSIIRMWNAIYFIVHWVIFAVSNFYNIITVNWPKIHKILWKNRNSWHVRELSNLFLHIYVKPHKKGKTMNLTKICRNKVLKLDAVIFGFFYNHTLMFDVIYHEYYWNKTFFNHVLWSIYKNIINNLIWFLKIYHLWRNNNNNSYEHCWIILLFGHS